MLNSDKTQIQVLTAISLTHRVDHWLATSHRPQILHVFNHACNLINENGEILSIVSPLIGNGPFHAVVKDQVDFTEALPIGSRVSISGDQLQIENLIVTLADARYWSPRPAWAGLYENLGQIASQLASLPIPSTQLPGPLIANISSAVARGDISSSKALASRLAGLGMGLTPSGDDFMMGAIYAAWMIHPCLTAQRLSEEIANTAAPLTTSLSAAYLRAAGRGEAGMQWHKFCEALISHKDDQIRDSMDAILSIGATSGEDALAGFLSTFAACWSLKR